MISLAWNKSTMRHPYTTQDPKPTEDIKGRSRKMLSWRSKAQTQTTCPVLKHAKDCVWVMTILPAWVPTTMSKTSCSSKPVSCLGCFHHPYSFQAGLVDRSSSILLAFFIHSEYSSPDSSHKTQKTMPSDRKDIPRGPRAKGMNSTATEGTLLEQKLSGKNLTMASTLSKIKSANVERMDSKGADSLALPLTNAHRSMHRGPKPTGLRLPFQKKIQPNDTLSMNFALA